MEGCYRVSDGYSVRVLADSISPLGVRLITLEATFPRFLLAEINTHRMFSRNSASSRAIPPEKQIERIVSSPFVPLFNKRVKGMGVGEKLAEQRMPVQAWLEARDAAVFAARKLIGLEADKSRINRLLEPFMWHTAIISATEWDNFFALRDNSAAQPEMQIIAKLMRDARDFHMPRVVDFDQWHLPLVSDDEVNDQALSYSDPFIDWEFWKKVSVGRCARVSYLTHDGTRDPEKDVELHDRLLEDGHFSPFEHPAKPMIASDFVGNGNFKGWKQYRKQIPFESNFAVVQKQRKI